MLQTQYHMNVKSLNNYRSNMTNTAILTYYNSNIQMFSVNLCSIKYNSIMEIGAFKRQNNQRKVFITTLLN